MKNWNDKINLERELNKKGKNSSKNCYSFWLMTYFKNNI